jgi:hypothetical protein
MLYLSLKISTLHLSLTIINNITLLSFINLISKYNINMIVFTILMTGTDAVSIKELLSMLNKFSRLECSLFISYISEFLYTCMFDLKTPDTKTSMSLESIARPVAMDPYMFTDTYYSLSKI